MRLTEQMRCGEYRRTTAPCMLERLFDKRVDGGVNYPATAACFIIT